MVQVKVTRASGCAFIDAEVEVIGDNVEEVIKATKQIREALTNIRKGEK
jgi:hypothetical protein